MKKIFLIGGGVDSSNYSDYETYLKSEEYNPYEEKVFGWKDHLKESFKNDFDIIQIPMPNKFFANYNHWKIMFEKALPYFGEENILIGHSLGGSFLLKYLNENSLKNISQIHLIAPAVFDSDEEKLGSFSFEKSLENFKNIENVFVYFSYDDFVVSFKDGEYLQSILNKAKFTTYKDKEHFIFVSEISELEENIKGLNNIKIKNNSVGDFYDISLKENKVYNIFTKKGNYRGGKIYSQDKYFTIINGSCKLITKEKGENIEQIIVPGTINKINANTPNLFYFLEDSEMLEWFDKSSKKEDFKEFSELK